MDSIHEAAYNGDVASLRSLLDIGAAPDGRDESGFTPLLWASFRAGVADMVPIIEALVEAGADPNAVTGNGDANCLILAVQAGNRDAVSALIAAGADVNGTADGLSPLIQAAKEGEAEILKQLLRSGADIHHHCGPYDAAHYARYFGFPELADILSADPPG